MRATVGKPWFRIGVDGAEILAWQGWVAFGVAGGGMAAIWRATSALPAPQQFALVAIFMVATAALMRRRAVDVADEGDGAARKPWINWLPVVVAIGFVAAFNLIPHIDDEAERMALTALATLPAALVKFIIERREARP